MIRYPPAALALMFWSWQTGAWVPGLGLTAWLAWAMRTDKRWQVSDKSLERLVDLTSLLVIGVVLYEYSKGPLTAGIFAVLRWSPLLLAPLVSAQILSARPGVTHRALFLSQRRSRSADADRTLDLRPVYLASCLLAAGTAPGSEALSSHFIGLLALAGAWLLWQQGARRHWPLMLGLLVITALLAYAGQLGLREGQSRLEDAAIAWMGDLFFGSGDPYRARTALGDIGELKLSDRVLYRVTTDAPLKAPLLLRTASYNRYFDTSWLTRERDFAPVPRVNDGWQWAPDATAVASTPSVRIGTYLKRRGDLLPLPSGTWRIAGLPVGILSRHPLGAVKASDGPPLVQYRAFYHEAASDDRPPDDIDLRVPLPEQAVLDELVDALALSQADPEAALQRVRDYFKTGFRYTLELPGPVRGQTALEHFLRDRRRGHCELFATASVLLLRQAGLPARYAVGYSVQEQAAAPNTYLVRRSHAHAWALVWHHDRWWSLDTTPALWANLEADRRPLWQPAADWISQLWYRFNLHRLNPETKDNPWLWALLAILSLILAYRLRLGRRFIEAGAAKRRTLAVASNSPIADVARTLTRAGWPRRAGETDRQWLQRLQREPELHETMQDIEAIQRFNERAHYHPAGLTPAQQRQLQREIARWQTRWESLRSRR
ncbi:transglutaminase-like domain-containing protein [Thiorhodococcus minor]|uniref:Transglutaminase domain-containing protein n=1 Tax=Thiorhodococcus minor TaxID=57489 RepID=A0A6M0K5C6_9GAMM|nr:transglutaminase domain-containing protein [Thiorhodococcus minor]NEV64454.1 transglutaminase domain-containing protein [Thiorhodococcus minor]